MRFYLFTILFSLLIGCIFGQAPIPQRPSGVVYPGSGSSDSAAIQFEIFIDPLCPDSKAAWPVVKQVAAHYQKNIRVLTHMFPLPYHTWSFMSAQGYEVVKKATGGNATALYDYIDLIFDAQDSFGNGVTSKSTSTDVINLFASTVQKAGLLSASTMVSGLNDRSLDWNARVEWKYACSRAILGTPSFLVNGVFVSAESTWSLADWQSVLDPLLPPAERMAIQSAKLTFHDVSECPAGTTECNYLPGKSACCPPSEYCIPNVGCRC